MALEHVVPPRRRTSAARSVARRVAVVAAVLAVADGFRWGNRWYLAVQLSEGADGGSMAAPFYAGAHDALARGLACLVVALVAAAVGWGLRVVRTP
ncbi:hypothetical protein [Cellulomonas endophytica]|uniref:hypothetical protein n=1 Tax=Cellulomonas endophytica TaxID=2494735 RepID=UPI001011311E|nr:hypothetical protein [Cellulomonas endophytica]